MNPNYGVMIYFARGHRNLAMEDVDISGDYLQPTVGVTVGVFFGYYSESAMSESY